MQVQNDAQPYDTINITPMLDLAYVLLVIFILMTTAGVQGLTMEMPKPSNKPSKEQHDLKIVHVQAGGGILINGVGVSVDQLEAQLNAARVKDPKVSVLLRGDFDATHGAMVEVMDLMTQMEFPISIVTGKIGT